MYKSGRRDKWAKNSKANGSPGSVASTVPHAQHRARRSALTHCFSKKAVDSLASIIEAKVDQLTHGIEHEFMQKSRVLNIGVAFTALTLDMISDYCFGQSWKCLESPDFAPEWKRTMTNLFEPVPAMRHFPWLMPMMQSLPDWVMAKMAPDMVIFQDAKKVGLMIHPLRSEFDTNRHDKNVQKQVERIIAERENPSLVQEKTTSIGRPINEDPDPDNVARTIFHTVLDSSLPASEKAVDRITDEAFVMVVAGGETTAKTLTNAVFHLLDNPQWLDRVLAELDQVMPDSSVLAPYTQLEHLPVLTAAIKETLRISAPVTNRVQVLDPEHQLMYKDWAIPRGTSMSMSVPGIHLDPDVFPEPYVFNPARWLDEETAKHANQYYMPFHRGYRNCIGQKCVPLPRHSASLST